MTTPCWYEGICRPDCYRRGDDCDGNVELMTEEERNEDLEIGSVPIIRRKFEYNRKV